MQALKTQVDDDRAVKHITEVIQPLSQRRACLGQLGLQTIKMIKDHISCNYKDSGANLQSGRQFHGSEVEEDSPHHHDGNQGEIIGWNPVGDPPMQRNEDMLLEDGQQH